jgi:hypothetical protein|tara:strand:+ start:852 stop:1247 length:396 start_codon:yes stop_codon:yes gene_type:complete
MATVSKITFEGDTGDFNRALGGTITAQVVMSEDVTVSGTPVLNLTNDNAGEGDSRVQWLEMSAHNGNEMTFSYTLEADDKKSGAVDDNITIGANALALNGGTIKNRASGDDATITHSAQAGSRLVTWITPT